MNITIFDKNEEYIKVLNNFIKSNPEFNYIKTEVIDVKDLKCGILVTAGNSFGVMGNGIDLAIRNLMSGIEEKVQDGIKRNFKGAIPVGKAFYVATNYELIPALIYAPTMFLPTILPQGSENALMATLAGIELARRFVEDSESIYIPILCVNSGKMNILDSIVQMCLGIEFVRNGCNISTHNDMVELNNRMKNFKYEI